MGNGVTEVRYDGGKRHSGGGCGAQYFAWAAL